jgi:branched-chain amino acid aminotransferase
MSRMAYLNGHWFPLKEARISVLDRGFLLGDGLFETMRAYGGRVFQLQEHLDRLYRSATAIQIEIHEPREKLSEIVSELVVRNEEPETMVRLTVSRGEDSGGPQIPSGIAPTLSIFTRPVHPLPQKIYLEGVGISLFPNTARSIAGLSRQVKSTNYLSQILVRRQAEEQGAFEGILLDSQGRLTDGATTNIFLVREGKLTTPAVNEYVLEGITRAVVLGLAEKLNLPFEECDLWVEDLMAAEEAFLTNTGIEILPAVRVDGVAIAQGRPGEITGVLRQEFRKIIDEFRGR